ncbi:MAG: diacylglycerol kinase family protein [Marinilabiliaceae bacterium]|nr:diacylglycerol kinase family protein [Marinilabiliaceae bacterium]
MSKNKPSLSTNSTFIKQRIASFKFALMGFKWLMRTEPNARFHLLATLMVLILGYILHLSTFEWLWIFLAVTLIFMAELLNTALEYLADALHPEHHPKIGKAKDMAAAATLLAAIFAVLTGIIVLGSKLLTFL